MNEKYCCPHHYQMVFQYHQDISSKRFELIGSIDREQLAATHLHLIECDPCRNGYKELKRNQVFKGSTADAIQRGLTRRKNEKAFDEYTAEEALEREQGIEALIFGSTDHNP